MLLTIEKYLNIVNISLQEFLAYRLNFILWRFRNVLNLILIYFLWSSVYVNKNDLFGYSKVEIVSYILIVNILGALVFSTKTNEVSDAILTGKIIDPLIKPFNYFGYIGSREIADKLLNLSFALIEILLIVIIFQPTLKVADQFLIYLWMIIFLVNGLLISFFISFILSIFAFWSTDIWGPKFIYFILTSLLAGIMFPLDVLPNFLYNIILMTPFPYMVYLPAKIFIHGLDSTNILQFYFISFGWIFILFFITKTLWKKGMKEFSFFGK
jgi:ABC-2 type transport system permease protein